MMGSAGELPSAPKEPIKFIEDMTEAEATAAVREQELYFPFLFLLFDIVNCPFFRDFPHDKLSSCNGYNALQVGTAYSLYLAVVATIVLKVARYFNVCLHTTAR